MGRDELEGFRAVTVVTGLEGRVVQRDGRIVAQHVVAAFGAAELKEAAGDGPARDQAVGRLVPLVEEERARAGLDDGARAAVGDDVARQGEGAGGGAADLVTDGQRGDRLREGGRARDRHAHLGLALGAAGERDRGGVDRQVVDHRGGVRGRTVDDRRHVGRTEVVEGGDGQVVALACAELLRVEAGDDFDADRVAEGKDAAGERDGAGAEAQRIVDDESTADGVGRETGHDLAADVGGLDVTGVDGRAAGVGVGADFVADRERRGDRGGAEARLDEGDGTRAVADDAGEDLTGLTVAGPEGQRARRGVVVRDEARARQAAEGEAEAVEVQRTGVVDLEVDAGVGGAAARRDGASPGEAQRAFLDVERAEDRGARGRDRHQVGRSAEDEVARAGLDEVGRGEVRVDGRGDVGLPFPHEDVSVRRRERRRGRRGGAAEEDASAAGDDRTGSAGAVHDQAAADETEGVRRVGQGEIAAELQAVLFDQAGDRGGRRGLAEIRLTRDARARRGGGVGVERGAGFVDDGEGGQARNDADAGAGGDAGAGDEHARDEARGAEDGDRVARQRRGEAVERDRGREAVTRLGGGGSGGKGADRQRTRADGRDRRTSRDARASDDHAGGKTRDIREGDRIGTDGSTHRRQRDLGRVGGTDAGGTGGRGGRAEDERGAVAVDRLDRGARRDAGADEDHARRKAGGGRERDVGGGTVRDEAADGLRQRDVGDSGGGKAVGGRVVDEGRVAAGNGGADHDAGGIDDAARTGHRRGRGREELLGIGAGAEVGDVAGRSGQRRITAENRQSTLGTRRLTDRSDGKLVGDGRRRHGDGKVTAAAIGQPAGGS